MSIELVTKYTPYVDELFTTESKHQQITNKSYSWDGAQTIKIYKVGTSAMHDYGRAGAASGNWSRYGEVRDLEATTESFTLRKDRSFTFVIDRLDQNETQNVLNGASALARQLREVVIPEIDTYVINKMIEGAGTKAEAVSLTPDNIYQMIIEGTNALDAAEVPETGRYLLVTPFVYKIMKTSPHLFIDGDVSEHMRLKGVIAMVDGMPIIRVPAARVPADFGFMIAHSIATTAPVKLSDYRTHSNPPGINGILVEGRICYDAFVLENKAKAIYYQPASIG